MNVWPLKFRPMPDASLLFADDAGGYFKADETFLARYAEQRLTLNDRRFLLEGGHAFRDNTDPAKTFFAYKWASRLSAPKELSYVILVPTLRCNLACDYCQVSRAAEHAPGFDWSEDTVEAVLRFLDGLTAKQVKIEFQGGEPLLRIDLLERIRNFARKRFEASQFVVCTNLQKVGPREWSFLDSDDTDISTSVDGDPDTHTRQRTHRHELTQQFLDNLAEAVKRLGPGKVSALPTIDANAPPEWEALASAYERFGVFSVYLRQVNYQGFARHGRLAQGESAAWNELHSDFVDFLIERNHRTGSMMEEYYFSHCLRRVLRSGWDGHVDIRNPNFFATDYLVIDFDGKFYPTDESRMMSRVGQIDLSVGDLTNGLDHEKIEQLNSGSSNNFDPDCIHCPYQAFCGSDVVDDISRYGRIDQPRHLTRFCQRQTAVFDKIFELIYSTDHKVHLSLAHWAGVERWSPELAPVLQ
jgi:His-Xaa-Ser system radical SAM maturase HxsB